MKIKQMLSLFLLFIVTAFILVACGNADNESNHEPNSENNEQMQEAAEPIKGEKMKDGTYRLEEENLDENGWKVFLEITVEDGKITSVDYDYLNEDGDLKSEDEEYQKIMTEKVGIGPKEFTEELRNNLVSTQDALSVDVVSGATSSSETFKNYAQQLIQAAQEGSTETIKIDNGAPLQDGVYKLEEKNIGSTGWRFVMEMTVEDGKITDSNYNYLNENNEYKTDDEEYQEKMTEHVGIGPQDFVPQLNQNLVDTQDPAEVEVISGATHSAEVFKIYAQQLINAAEKGNEEPIVIDNFVYSN